MKTKFEENVASEIPKTRSAGEPELPWKVTEEEMDMVAASREQRQEAVAGTPPLQVRAIFVILLVVSIFVAILNTVMNVAIDNSEIQLKAMKNERAVVSLKVELQKTEGEKTALSDAAAKLEKKVSDLSEQKELYTSVIETLTKKTDDTQIKE